MDGVLLGSASYASEFPRGEQGRGEHTELAPNDRLLQFIMGPVAISMHLLSK